METFIARKFWVKAVEYREAAKRNKKKIVLYDVALRALCVCVCMRGRCPCATKNV